MNWSIRPAREADAGAIAHVHVDTWRTTYAGLIPDEFLARLNYERRESQWRAVLSNPDSAEWVYVAEDDAGEIVGFASGGPERSGDADYKGELYAIYVLAASQGKGIGRALTHAHVQRQLEAGLTSMLVWVLAENPSCAFYESLGGQPVRERQETVGDTAIMEVGYGWMDIRPLAL
jgi:GNAT superfamily N-acetyltransferase